MIEEFKEIASLITAVGPKLDAVAKLGSEAVMIETVPLLVQNKYVAKIWGPFETNQEAHNYINIKMDRHRLANAHRFGKAGDGLIENDGHFMGHPDFKYRVVSAEGYFAKYLAQIMLSCCSALVGIATRHDEKMFLAPGGEHGILDQDEGDTEEDE